MSKIRVGVVGVGHLGRHHVRLLKGLDCELVAVAEPNEKARAQAVAEHGVQGFADYRELLPLVDAVSKLCQDLVVVSEAHARPRRWAMKRSISMGVENALCAAGEMQSWPTGTPRAAAISGVTLVPGSTPP